MVNTFVDAIANQESRTTNGMKARKGSANAVVDLFYKIGASRGKDIIPTFVAAFVEDADLATRVAAWARDVRGGAGERQLFKDILAYFDRNDADIAKKMIDKIPELGRWDDMLIEYQNADVRNYAYSKIKTALREKDGLCAKWLPRKGKTAVQLRNAFRWSPKFYRKTLVNLTKVVETDMCANKWDKIDFNHVPSLAQTRYKRAFYRHVPEAYSTYTKKLVRGDADVKINAGAVYPYDILKGKMGYYSSDMTKAEENAIIAQWDALENFVGEANILPMVDVSGSMSCSVCGGTSLSCMDVAVSLGLYLADKNEGKFADTFLTFSASPNLVTLKGNIVQKMDQMIKTDWSMNTNLHAAFDKVLKTAVDGNVPQDEMPKIMLILSDMQFDYCTNFDDSAMQMIKRKYEKAGYVAPQIVFWNINSHDNVPVKANSQGAALVSGFSPSIAKAVLAADLDNFTPEAIMLNTIMDPKYKVL